MMAKYSTVESSAISGVIGAFVMLALYFLGVLNALSITVASSSGWVPIIIVGFVTAAITQILLRYFRIS